GYRVFNTSTAIKNCDLKGLMHLILSNNNINIPRTILSPMIFDYSLNSEDYLINCYEALGESVIIKESMGSFGMQVYLINNREEFINKVKEVNKTKIDFINQEN
ncbi:RimK family alpha-L-glutamate ligase, partial [Clostridium sp. HCS.1]